MKLVNTFFLALLVSSCTLAEANYPKHYDTYTSKIASCIQVEKDKEALSSSGLKGISKDSLIATILYLKEKRIVDCSYREELDSLTRTLNENKDKVDYQLLEDRYLSFSLIKKETSFLKVNRENRNTIIDASKGKSLEINLLDFFDSIK